MNLLHFILASDFLVLFVWAVLMTHKPTIPPMSEEDKERLRSLLQDIRRWDEYQANAVAFDQYIKRGAVTSTIRPSSFLTLAQVAVIEQKRAERKAKIEENKKQQERKWYERKP